MEVGVFETPCITEITDAEIDCKNLTLPPPPQSNSLNHAVNYLSIMKYRKKNFFYSQQGLHNHSHFYNFHNLTVIVAMLETAWKQDLLRKNILKLHMKNVYNKRSIFY